MPDSPLKKEVSFNPALTVPPSSASVPLKKRRSSIKQGTSMPFIPSKETYQHPDALIRRLRLKDSWGKPVNLESEFRDTRVVLFLFGATWPGSSDEPFKAVEDFAKRHPHRLKVVYCSCDTSEKAYLNNTRAKPWLSMDWNDGSNEETPSTSSTSPATTPTIEPFLLATDPDLEDEVHTTDLKGELYLRPYSRVYLAEKFAVLGVPGLVAYHLPSAKVLTTHARFESLKGDKGEATWNKWEIGESVEISFSDVVAKMKWTIGMGVVAAAYVVAVRVGGVEDVVGKLTETLTRNYLGR